MHVCIPMPRGSLSIWGGRALGGVQWRQLEGRHVCSSCIESMHRIALICTKALYARCWKMANKGRKGVVGRATKMLQKYAQTNSVGGRVAPPKSPVFVAHSRERVSGGLFFFFLLHRSLCLQGAQTAFPHRSLVLLGCFFSLSLVHFLAPIRVLVCVSVAISRLQPVLLVSERTQRCAPHSAILDGEMHMFALHWLQ